jgi:hypothetical protein
VLPVLASPRQGPVSPWSLAVFPPCALTDPHQQALGVDIRDLERCPFPEAEPTRGAHPPTPPSVRALDHGEQGPDFSRAQHDGPLWGVPGSHTVEDRPWALQRPLVEEPDPLEVHAEGALGDVRLGPQAEAILAELHCAELVGSASRVASQLLHRGDIALLGLGGEPPQRQVCQHPASEGSHRDPPVHGGYDLAQKGYGEQEDTGSRRSAKEEREARNLDRIDSNSTAQRFRSTTIRLPNQNLQTPQLLQPITWTVNR